MPEPLFVITNTNNWNTVLERKTVLIDFFALMRKTKSESRRSNAVTFVLGCFTALHYDCTFWYLYWPAFCELIFVVPLFLLFLLC